MEPTRICSIDGCKRAITCLCRHCEQDVCKKHFNEHQTEVDNQLIPIADRLNECRVVFFCLKIYGEFVLLVKMRLQIDRNPTNPMAMLEKWRDERYEEINREYDDRVRVLQEQISKQDEEVSRTISDVQELINEGDVSIDQVKQMEQNIERLTRQVDHLLIGGESDWVGKEIQLGGIRYRVKARVQCESTDLYALESERAMMGYDGVCPKCNGNHVRLEPNRGLYALVKTIETKVSNIK